MNVTDFSPVPNSKLGVLTHLLSHMFGIQLDWERTDEELAAVLKQFNADRKNLSESEQSYDYSNPEYTKLVLMTEAIHLYLIEIAPKRKKTPRRVA